MANNLYGDAKGRYSIKPVTIEVLDTAVVDYFSKKLIITVEDDSGAENEKKKVPVVFAIGERWKLIRDNKGIRDANGTLILPIIAIRRTDIDRTPGFGGLGQEVNSLTISNVIHPKTSNIQNLIEARRVRGFPEIKKKPVIETLTIPFPDFATVYYEISVWTQHQTQMNEILEKIFHNYNFRDSFIIPVDTETNTPKGNSYYFVGFREGNIASESNIEEFSQQERIIKYAYRIKVPAYFILDPKDESISYGKDEKGNKVVYKEQNTIDVKLKEQVGTLEDFQKLFG